MFCCKHHIKISVVRMVLGAAFIATTIFILSTWTNMKEPIIVQRYEPIRQYLLVESANHKRNISLPVIVNPFGGMGNQLFEFACVYAIARKRNSNVYILKPPDHALDKEHNTAVRLFSLDHFKIPFSKSVAEEDFSAFGSGRIFDFSEHHIWERSIPTDTVLRLGDGCASEVYFKEYSEEIKEMFTLNIDETPIRDILAQVENTQSISVHVRRGDYMYSSEKRSIPLTFQKKAMKMMQRFFPNATFFIFSDDLDFVRAEMRDYKNTIFVDNTGQPMASLLDFLIMSRCKHNIIANSTFSWWAAYLNRNKNRTVIGPYPRHPPGWNELHYKDNVFRKYRELVLNYYLYPTDWLTMNSFEY